MATNPMQRKARNSFILGMLVMLVICGVIIAFLFIQIIVSIILLILFSINYSSSNLISKFIYIGGIYALIQSNSFVRDFIGSVSTNVTQIVKSFHK